MNDVYSNKQLYNASVTFPFQDELDIKKILSLLHRHIWIILIISFSTGFIALLYTFTMTPLYQTSASLQIRLQSQGNNLLTKLGYKSNSDSAIDTQEALIKTRYILEPVIIKSGLNIIVTPKYFPLFGQWKAMRYSGETVAKPFLGLSSYAWGGESIKIKSFSVPIPKRNQKFKLVIGENNTYRLFSSENNLILKGKMGIPISQNAYHLEVTELKARPNTEFQIRYYLPASMINSVVRKIKINNILGNDPNQNTGIFQLTFTDNDSTRAENTLNELIKFIVIRNAQQNAETTQKTLNFLELRLPELRKKLDEAEDFLNQYHRKTTTLSMSLTGRILLQQLSTVEQNLDKVMTHKQDLLQTYTHNHPLVLSVLSKEDALKNRLKEIKAKIKKFPFINQEEINLQREVKLKNLMYTNLLNIKQQLQIAKSGLTSDVILLSDATPPMRLSNHKILFIIMGFLMGAFLSAIFIIIRNLFTKTIENSEQVEDLIQIPVQCVLPHSRRQKQIEKKHQKTLKTLGNRLSPPVILAKQEPDDITVESLRSLRISLQINFNKESKLIALMGSLSNIGKSFVSLNLSQVIADSGKKTLLIDGDVRKGQLHKATLVAKSNGLSEYLEGKCSLENIIHSIDNYLSFISCGKFTTHPIQLFQNARFKELIELCKAQFDQIIIDTPPIIPVIDSVLIAQLCDIKLFVVSAGKDTLTDVKQAIKKTKTHEIDINGIVLNHRKSLVPYGSKYYNRYSYGEPVKVAG